ncbi:MAG: MutS2/Smr-associated SH3 domain-containing protein [Salibacteraceae bacterium]
MKALFDQQTNHDLAFNAIQALLAEACHSRTAREMMDHLAPLENVEEANYALDVASELFAIQTEESGVPRIEFDELKSDIKRLGISNGVLDLEGFIRVLHASRLINEFIIFLDKRDHDYPLLCALLHRAYFTNEIISPIEKVLDKRNQIKDDASVQLLKIRHEIKSTRNSINKNFDKVRRKLERDGFLAETVETFINSRRVLSVLSNHKRQIAGNVVGASKTGSFTYIEPRENILLNNELEMLLDDERKEIRRILLKLTNDLRVHQELIESYQYLLITLDVINAKVKLARTMDGVRPALEADPIIELHEAYHPLLLLSNKQMGDKTIPQSLYMDEFSRMMVISGPNAGGKSITLKTVGLLQIMVQCGLLVPCDPSSKFGWFHAILTDIGDNQSIANQLSTYSYRLKRMKYFLEKANKRSLLLLDEFGTGSDPELGGALAEVFFEKLYNQQSFGVITTHYANIKLKAAHLQNAVNASMLFDSESLEPLFKLSVGQPGSSFTFEVAQINGIPKDLIEEAKTRLDANKVEIDELIATLQREKSQVEHRNVMSKNAEHEANEAKYEYEALLEHYEARLQKQQVLIEKNNKTLAHGNKMSQFINSYRLKGQNKKLLDEVKKFLAIEKSKVVKKREQAKNKTRQSTENQKKTRNKRLKANEKMRPLKPIEVGSLVRIKNSTKQGEVLEVNGKDAIVLFGNFKTKAKVSELEVV